MSQYQKGKANLDFAEARDTEWQWHQLGHMQACTSLHTDNHASTAPLKFFTDRMPFLPPNQQRQSTEDACKNICKTVVYIPLLLMCGLFACQYADPVTDLLDKWGVFRARLFRESCVFHRGNYVKVSIILLCTSV